MAKPEIPEITQQDRETGKQIQAALLSGELDERDLLKAVDSGQLSPGVVALVTDMTDLGRIRADQYLEKYKSGEMQIKDGQFT